MKLKKNSSCIGQVVEVVTGHSLKAKSPKNIWARRLFRLSGVLAVALSASNCAQQEQSNAAACTPKAQSDIVLAYTHSANYPTYKLDWIEYNGCSYATKADQLAITASGLRSPTVVGDYLLLVDSSSTGRLLAYSRSGLTLAGQINVGSYPQDMVVVNGTAYIADGAMGTNLLKRVDVSALPSMSSLSDITVGNQPSVVRYLNSRIYVGNQDWQNKSQATVSVINPTTNMVETTFNTGPNNMDIAFDGTRVWTYNADWYNNSFVCQQNATLTYAPVSNHTPATVTPPSGYDTSSNCAKSGLAFNNSGGFVALRHSSGEFHLFSISGTTLNTTPVDNTNRYIFVGNGSEYLYKIHNGDGSTSTLTVTIENLSGTNLATVNLTKDTDMYFFALR